MSEISSGTVLITGPTGGLGRSATMAMANRPEGERPGLLLIGRPGHALAGVAAEARAAGATVREIGCDLASLAAVHTAAETAKELLESGVVRPLRGLIANAGLSVADTRDASADGYELTFAVNYLAHAQLIGDLLYSFATPARIVLVGSNTYYANWVRRLMTVPAAEWRDPLELAKPGRIQGLADTEGCGCRLLELQAGDPLLRPRAAAARARGDQRGRIRARVHARHGPLAAA